MEDDIIAQRCIQKSFSVIQTLTSQSQLNCIIYKQLMKKGNSWLPHEDAAFRQIHLKQAIQKWKDVSWRLANQYGIHKTPKQCRERFKNHLNPSISKELWSPEETDFLLELHHQMGNRWAAISRRLPGRNDNCVKNKLYSVYRQSMSNINNVIRRVKNDRFKQINMSFITKLIALYDSKLRQDDRVPEEVAYEAEILKDQIIKFRDISEAQMVQRETQLPQLMARVQLINQQFKRKAVKIKRTKSSSFKINSFLPTERKRATEHPQQKQRPNQNQKNDQIAAQIIDETHILVIPFVFDKIRIRGSVSEEEDDLWEEGWKSDESQVWDGNRWRLDSSFKLQ